MATFTNESKNSTTLTNQDPSPADTTTWAEHDESWTEAEGTWENPKTSYSRQTKNSTDLTNESKN